MSSIRKRTWTDRCGEQHHAWLVDYRDSTGKRRAKQFARKKDAEAWATRTVYQVSQGTHTPDSVSITFRKAADQWIERARREGLEPTTVAAYDQHVRLHLNPLCGDVKLSQLSTPMVESYRDKLVDRLSRPMAIRVLRSLTSIIAEAQRRGQVAQNVALAVRVKRQQRQRAKAVIPPKATLKALLAASRASEDRQAPPLVMLGIFAGLRASELRGLSWRQLDLSAPPQLPWISGQMRPATSERRSPQRVAGRFPSPPAP